MRNMHLWNLLESLCISLNLWLNQYSTSKNTISRVGDDAFSHIDAILSY